MPETNEFILHVPKRNESERYSILKFSNNLAVDVTQWKQISLVREDNEEVYQFDFAKEPKTGAGSEFGKESRAMARKKKLGHNIKEYRTSDQPWILDIQGKGSKKYKGNREGGIGEHSSYWILIKTADGFFEAHPVSEWYNFMPIARHKTLDIDEAEEQFQRRNKIMNQFAVMKQATDLELGEELSKSSLSNFKLTDERISDDSGKEDRDGEAEDTGAPNTDSKNAKQKKRIKSSKSQGKIRKKRSEEDGEDNIASDDSDDGDEEGREVDYMSDTNSSSSDDMELEKVDKALVGVEEEGGLRGMLAEEDEEGAAQNEDDGDIDSIDASALEPDAPPLKLEQKDMDDSSGESSDSDDPDKGTIKSALFLQKAKPKQEEPSDLLQSTSQIKREITSNGLKRNEVASLTNTLPTKKIKLEKQEKSKSNSLAGGITEAEVKRYLQRKPHSTKDLVAKFKNRCQGMSKEDMVTRLANILKKLNPDQYKANGVLYFTIKN